jgi:hypothetical protein
VTSFGQPLLSQTFRSFLSNIFVVGNKRVAYCFCLSILSAGFAQLEDASDTTDNKNGQMHC